MSQFILFVSIETSCLKPDKLVMRIFPFVAVTLFNFFFLTGVCARAEFRLATGEHLLTASDMILKNKSEQVFKINRYYNHKITVNGILGSKWCFEFDHSFQIIDQGLQLVRCGVPTGIIFQKTGKYNYSFNGDKVWLNADYSLVRQTLNHEIYVYAPSGRLVTVLQAHDKKLLYRLIYSKKTNFIESINLPGKAKLAFLYDKDGNLTEIKGPEKKSVKYNLTKGLLVYVTDSWNRKVDYVYDQNHRITSVNSASGLEKLKFNKSNLVEAFSKNGCVNHLAQVYDISKAQLIYNVKSSCPGRTKQLVYNNSPIFQKNKEAFKNKIERGPASIELKKKKDLSKVKIFKNKNNLAEAIETAGYIWKIKYLASTNKITEVEELNKKTKQKEFFRISYKEGWVSTISDSKNNRVDYEIESNGTIKNMKYQGDKRKSTMAAMKIKNLNAFKEGT